MVGGWAAEIGDRGWTVLHDLVAPAVVDEVESTLAPLLADWPTGRNDFEGRRTRRIYNLLAKGDVFQQLVGHDAVLDLVESVLGPHFQLSATAAIQILPGEGAQGLHTDDALVPVPRPHPPMVLNTMWAIDPFTADNGATQVVTGSHRGTGGVPEPVEMPRGSVLAWLGDVLHGGGANRSDRPRLGITVIFNQSWLRQQENQYLALPPDLVERLPDRLRRVAGWDVHPPFIGNVEGRNPARRRR